MRIRIITLGLLLGSCGGGHGDTSSVANELEPPAPSQASARTVDRDQFLVDRALATSSVDASEVAEFPGRARPEILRWVRLNAACRGGTPEGATDKDREHWLGVVCNAREQAYEVMKTAGYCYGKSWQAGYQMRVHACSEGNRPSIDALSEADLAEVPTGAYCNAVDARGRTLFAATDFAVVKLDRTVLKLPLGENGWSSTRFKSDEQDVQVDFAPRAGERTEGEESVTEPMVMTVTADGHSTSVPVRRTCGA